MIHLFLENDSFILENDSFVSGKMVWGPVPNNGKWFSCSYRSIRAPENGPGKWFREDDSFILEMIHLFLENDSFTSGKMIHLIWKMIHLFPG